MPIGSAPRSRSSPRPATAPRWCWRGNRLTTYDTDEEISRALKAGARAYVLKDISADDLVTCIRDVLAGKTYLAPAAAAKLAEEVTRVQHTPPPASACGRCDGLASETLAFGPAPRL